jgi:hypothetical protein
MKSLKLQKVNAGFGLPDRINCYNIDNELIATIYYKSIAYHKGCIIGSREADQIYAVHIQFDLFFSNLTAEPVDPCKSCDTDFEINDCSCCTKCIGSTLLNVKK